MISRKCKCCVNIRIGYLYWLMRHSISTLRSLKMKLALIYFLLCSHAFLFLYFKRNNFVLSKQVMSSINIPHWMRSYCFSSSQLDSSMFCQKTGGDFCQTASLAAGRPCLVLLQHPEAGKTEASTSASIFSLWEEAFPQLTPKLPN